MKLLTVGKIRDPGQSTQHLAPKALGCFRTMTSIRGLRLFLAVRGSGHWIPSRSNRATAVWNSGSWIAWLMIETGRNCQAAKWSGKRASHGGKPKAAMRSAPPARKRSTAPPWRSGGAKIHPDPAPLRCRWEDPSCRERRNPAQPKPDTFLARLPGVAESKTK
jgi:hypothetical protein